MLITVDETARGKLATIRPANSGTDGPVRFSLVPSAASALFSLHARTGVLKVLDPAALDYETADRFELTVLVTTGRGKNKRTEEIDLDVRLTNILEDGETRLVQKQEVAAGFDLGKVHGATGAKFYKVFDGEAAAGERSDLFEITDGRLVIKEGAYLAAGRYTVTLAGWGNKDTKTLTVEINDIDAPFVMLNFRFEPGAQTQTPDLLPDRDGDGLVLVDTTLTSTYGSYVVKNGVISFVAKPGLHKTTIEYISLPVIDSRGAEGFVEVWVRIKGFIVITGTDRSDKLKGTHIDDVIYGYGKADVIDGGHGDDELFGGTGHDKIDGGYGNDELFGEDGHDRLFGGFGDDELFGGDGRDLLSGGRGADTLDGGVGWDILSYEKSGDSVVVNLATGEARGRDADGDHFSNFEGLKGSFFSDVLSGDDADNLLSGLNKSDELNGGGGNDVLLGGRGADTLNGGAGADLLIDNEGSSRFVLERAEGSRAQDTVVSFLPDGRKVFEEFEDVLKHTLPQHWNEDWFIKDTLQVTLSSAEADGFDFTLAGLKAAANIRWDADTFYIARPQTDVSSHFFTQEDTNDPNEKDTVFYYTHGTADTTDDEIIMVLEDFSTPIEMDMFTLLIH